jgi:hypothetical protein
MKTVLISLLAASSLMAAGSASAQLSQNWSLAQCQKAWGHSDKKLKNPTVYTFDYQVINNIEVGPCVRFSDHMLVSVAYEKNSADDFTQDEVVNFLLENAPDVIWSNEVHPDSNLKSNSESTPEWGLLFWIGIDKLSGEVKYSASTSEGRHGSAILEINRGTKAAF